MIPLVDLRTLIERILTRHDLLNGAQSPLGHDLEVAWMYSECNRRQGSLEQAGLAWQRIDRADARHVEFAYLTSLAALWTEEEESVLKARHTPATPAELASRMPTETNERERIAWRTDVRSEKYMDDNGMPQIRYRTAAGELVVHDCEGDGDRCTRDPVPNLREWLRTESDVNGRWCMRDPARVIVRGSIPKYPNAHEIAKRLGMKAERVYQLTSSSYRKLRDELEKRMLREATEQGANA